jgi:putative transposase
MRKQQRSLQLTGKDHSYLTNFLAKGTVNVRMARRASALLQLHQGTDLNKVAAALGVVYQTVAQWRDKYFESGLAFLEDKPRSGRPNFFDGLDCAKITSLACSETPEGRAKWSLRLLADRAVELELVEQISYSKVREILKKTNLNPT